MIRILVELVKASDLQPGDLFSLAPIEKWESVNQDSALVGEMVYIRTNVPTPEADDPDVMLVLLTIEQVEESEEIDNDTEPGG